MDGDISITVGSAANVDLVRLPTANQKAVETVYWGSGYSVESHFYGG